MTHDNKISKTNIVLAATGFILFALYGCTSPARAEPLPRTTYQKMQLVKELADESKILLSPWHSGSTNPLPKTGHDAQMALGMANGLLACDLFDSISSAYEPQDAHRKQAACTDMWLIYEHLNSNARQQITSAMSQVYSRLP